MATYLSDDFTGTNGDAPDTGKWTVTAASGTSATIQSNKLRLSWGATQWLEVGITSVPTTMGSADQDIYFNYTITSASSSGDCMMEMKYRRSGTTYYMLEIGHFNQNYQVTNPSRSVILTGNHGGGVGDTVHVRVQCFGTTHRIKTWLNGAGEPTTWADTETDSGATADGTVGLLIYPNNNVSGTTDVDDFTVSSIDFPYYVGTANTEIGTSMGASQALNMPTGIVAGEVLIAQIAIDSARTLTTASSGWAKLGGINDSNMSGAVFAKIAAGGDTITVDGGTTQDYASVVYRVTNHGASSTSDLTFASATYSTANTSPDPPNCNPGVSKKYLWLEGFVADDDDNATTYWSSGFVGIAQPESAQSSSSCMTAAAWTHSEASAFNPGAMTLAASEEWWAWTIAVPPSAGGAASVSATALSTTTTLTTPSVKGGAAFTQTALSVTTTLTTPTVKGGAAFTQVALSTTTSFPTPTVTVGAGVTVTLSTSTSLPTPTVTGGAAFTQTPLGTSISLPTPSVSGGAGVSQSTLAVSTSLPTPTVKGGAGVSQSTLAVSTSLPTPTINGGAAFTQTTLALSTSFPTPAVSGGAGISQSTLSLSTSLPTPAVSVTNNTPADVAPTTLAVSTSLPTPTVTGGAGISQATLAITTSLPVPSVTGGAAFTQTALGVSTSFPAVSVGGGGGTTTTLAVSTSFPQPTISTGVTVTPSVLSVTTSFPTPGITVPSVEAPIEINPNRRKRGARRPKRDG